MPKDILLYGAIWEYNALYFFDQIKEALTGDASAELNIRINSEGGSPEYGMSIIEKIQELQDQISVKVGAMAHSMALFILPYIDADRSECIDTTKAVLHRAAYPDYIESSNSFKGSIFEEILVKTNNDLEKAFRARVNVEVLEALPQFKDKNLTLKDIFSMEGRAEVLLTASDLKKLGLVSRINKITPAKSAELKVQAEKFTKCRSLEDFKMAAKSIAQNPQDTNTIVMNTLAELKEKFPMLYDAAVEVGRKAGHAEGVAQEADRIGAAMVFAHLDPEGVKKIIASGKPMTATQQAEFALKAMSPAALKKMKDEAAGEVETEEVDGEGENAEAKALEKNLRASLGLDKSKPEERRSVVLKTQA